MAEKITAALDRMQAEVVAAVTAPREFIRDSQGRPQSAISLYNGELSAVSATNGSALDREWGHLERRPA
jgi:hypothetical protein